MLITERSTYMEYMSVTLSELLLGGCRHVYAVPRLLHEIAERASQRRKLATLEDWQLDDIGLTSGDVAQELAKPFRRD